jgi:TnpA family transposase
MPRREILSPAQREELLVILVDRAGLIEHYVLSEQDLSLIRQRRGDHNRLGIALQLALLRFPGTALRRRSAPTGIDQFPGAAIACPFQCVGRVCSA